MNITITNEDKKIFIKWLLKRHKMKRRESVWILNYLLGHSQLLSNVHFIENAGITNRGMIISATNTEDIPFKFYKGSLASGDAEKAFHDLRLNPDEKMYIQINFSDRHQSQEYLAVLEDVDVMGNLLKKEGVIDVSEEIERLVSEITISNSRASLMIEIDKTLDSGDIEMFMQLSKMLIEQEYVKSVSFSV